MKNEVFFSLSVESDENERFSFNQSDFDDINSFVGFDNIVRLSEKGAGIDTTIWMDIAIDILAGLSVEIIINIIRAMKDKLIQKNKSDKNLPLLKIHAENKKTDFNIDIEFNEHLDIEATSKMISSISKMFNDLSSEE